MTLGDLIEAVESSLIGIDVPGRRERGFLDIVPVDGAKAYALADFLDAAQAEVRKYDAALARPGMDAQAVAKLRDTEIALVPPRLFTREALAQYRFSAGQLRSMRALGMIEEAAPAAKEAQDDR